MTFGPSACLAVAGLMDARTPSPLQLVGVSIGDSPTYPFFTSHYDLNIDYNQTFSDDPCITLDALNTTLGSLYQVTNHTDLM